MEVGGFVFKASTIEHIILRHPEEVNHVSGNIQANDMQDNIKFAYSRK